MLWLGHPSISSGQLLSTRQGPSAHLQHHESSPVVVSVSPFAVIVPNSKSVPTRSLAELGRNVALRTLPLQPRCAPTLVAFPTGMHCP